MSSSRVLSHNETSDKSIETVVEEITAKINERGDLPDATVGKQLQVLEELVKFPLGRFLLQNKGLNGFWTNYIVRHPFRGRLTGTNNEGQPFNLIEKFLLDKAPIFIATQQRFINFQQVLQSNLKSDSVIASIPCGLMGDLLTLHYSKDSKAKLIGIDVDQESLDQAKEQAKIREQASKTEFRKQDAWDLDSEEEFDMVTSNGLNIYEQDDEKTVDLYKKINKSLKAGGIFVTSFLTFPPGKETKSSWDISAFSSHDLSLQKTIFEDVIDVKWTSYKTPKDAQAQLKKAGFKKTELIYDDAKIFPTVVAYK